MIRKYCTAAFSALTVLGFAGVSEAHTFGAYGTMFGAGFLHPLGGLDHVLVMLGVGLWAGQMGKDTAWKLPALFVTMTLVGGVAGMIGISLPFAEAGIALSVLVVGIVIALSWNTGVVKGLGMAGLFAVFHGYAHGAEIPQAVMPALYSAGFILATSILLVMGSGAGSVIRRAGISGMHWREAVGGFIATAGVVFLVSA
jgi:urease accessory protein